MRAVLAFTMVLFGESLAKRKPIVWTPKNKVQTVKDHPNSPARIVQTKDQARKAAAAAEDRARNEEADRQASQAADIAAKRKLRKELGLKTDGAGSSPSSSSKPVKTVKVPKVAATTKEAESKPLVGKNSLGKGSKGATKKRAPAKPKKINPVTRTKARRTQERPNQHMKGSSGRSIRRKSNKVSRSAGERSRRAVGPNRGSSMGRVTADRDRIDIILPNGMTLDMARDEIINVRKIATSRKWGQNLTRKISRLISARVALNFMEQKDSSGLPWAELSESTIQKRSRSGAQHRDTGLKKDIDGLKGMPRRRKKGETERQFERRKAETLKSIRPDIAQARSESFSRHTLKDRPIVHMGDRDESGDRKKAVATNLIPLIDSASMFESLVLGVTRRDEDKDAEKAEANPNYRLNGVVDRIGNAPAFLINSKGDIVIRPKDLSKKNRVKFVVHNRPTSAGGYTPSNVPGREFFFLKKDDEEFISLALTAWILASSDDAGVARRAGSDSRRLTGVAMTTWETAPDRIKARTGAAESIDSLLGLAEQKTSDMLDQEGVYEFISAARGIKMSTKKRINKMRKNMGIKV
jgi:hypothetical protein